MNISIYSGPVTSPLKKKAKSIKWRGTAVAFKKSAKTEETVYFFDKNTGEKFARLSSVLKNDISHYHLKSEMSGKIVLLSEYGIQRRFSETPDGAAGRIMGIVPRFFP